MPPQPPPPPPPPPPPAGPPADDGETAAGVKVPGVRVPAKLAARPARKRHERLVPWLAPDETLLVLSDASRVRSPSADTIVVTTTRVLLLQATTTPQLQITWHAYAGEVTATLGKATLSTETLLLRRHSDDSQVKVPLPHGGAELLADTIGSLAPPDPQLRARIDAHHTQTAAGHWPDRRGSDGATTTARPADPSAWVAGLKVYGRTPNPATARILARHADGQDPWMVLSSWGAGVLAAFDDRLVLIKAGLGTSFMAGTLGGHRATTFDFTEITGIEYNAGLLNGVLEILTASYQGTANRDYWRGTHRSRNADANDPFTLSNTLPLTKGEYAQVAKPLAELRRRISESKRPQAAASPAPARDDLSVQLTELADLHARGVLSDAEFTAAKARLLDR